jgi:hypothetical protein
MPWSDLLHGTHMVPGSLVTLIGRPSALPFGFTTVRVEAVHLENYGVSEPDSICPKTKLSDSKPMQQQKKPQHPPALLQQQH